ncbi:MAG: DUF86 domain-containing protein [Methanoregula sp.]|nr:DUF86 domain-containing protein [Methanoregula sp.]
MADEIRYLMDVGSRKSIGQIIDDPSLKRAVVRSIEILGEASKNISAGLKQQHPEINWDDIAGIRDVLAHRYFGVDWDVVADVVFSEIPRLKIQIETMLKEIV